MLHKTLIGLFLVGLAGCSGCHPLTPPPNNPTTSDSGVDVVVPAPPPIIQGDCSTACTNAGIVCPSSEGLKGPCFDSCNRTNKPNYTSCILAATDCPSLKKCGSLPSASKKPVINGK